MFAPLGPAGQYGIITDIPPHELPLNAWSSGRNVHFQDGYAEKMLGQKSLWGGASIAPYFSMAVRDSSGVVFWVYAGSTAVYAYKTSNATHYDITRAAGAYTSAGNSGWQGGVLNGVAILNNGVDAPQSWSPVSSAQLLVNLPNWPASTTAKIIRAFRNFLIALDVTKSGTRDARLVKWSHPAAAGAVPSSWDETDATKDAGEYSLAETEGILMDCIPLRDTNIIYKDDSIWGMQYVGGQDIFKFTNLFRTTGVIGKHCALEYQMGKHLVLTKDDIVTHDGQAMNSVLRARMRSWFFNSIDPVYASRSFLVADNAQTEAWVCFPETGNTWPNKAIVWNWTTGACGVRDLPTTPHIASGLLDEGAASDNWNSDASTWATPGTWAETGANMAVNKLLISDYAGSKLLGVVASAVDFAGSTETVSLERTGLGVAFQDGVPPDISAMKFCSRIWPKITGTVGMVVQVRIGTQMHVDESPTWGAWQDFTIGTTDKIDCTVSGRLFALGFQSTGTGSWKLQGVTLDVQKIGDF